MIFIKMTFSIYSMFLCTTTNSALTTALVSTAKSAITTVIGMYTFGGVVPTAAFVLGQTLNFAGGCLYSYIKLNQRRKQDELRIHVGNSTHVRTSDDTRETVPGKIA